MAVNVSHQPVMGFSEPCPAPWRRAPTPGYARKVFLQGDLSRGGSMNASAAARSAVATRPTPLARVKFLVGETFVAPAEANDRIWRHN